MSQIIIRILDTSEEIEIYHEEDSKAIFEKIINREDLIVALSNALLPNKKIHKVEVDLIDEYDENTFYIELAESNKLIYYKFEERKIKCQYQGKGYSIIHPNTIFIIKVNDGRVYSIKAFCYKQFTGKSTELFKYPFANMLGQNSMCLGTIDNSYTTPLKAILTAIEANYTHDLTGFNDKELKDTKTMFEYLSKNQFPYNLLQTNYRTLAELLDKKIGVEYDE